MLGTMRIGELARRTGTTTKTIRFYEEIGLLPAPDRSPNDYRDYPEAAVDRLRFVRDAQATGLTLTEIGSILDLRSDGEATCQHVVGLLEHHLDALDEHIAALRRTREKLADLTDRARSLDPADCVDPNRCQTISHGYAADADASRVGRVLHSAPSGHHH
jgi:DNA-binding transcriptional MerR regulator